MIVSYFVLSESTTSSEMPEFSRIIILSVADPAIFRNKSSVKT